MGVVSLVSDETGGIAMRVIECPRRGLLLAAVAIVAWSGILAAAEPTLTLVVMDPLAAPLSCPCVKGYAQRDYTKLGVHLEKALGRPVAVIFGESLTKVVGTVGEGKNARADIVIGKRSVVAAEGKNTKRTLLPVADLTDLKGSTTQHGLVVVRGDDPAESIADLANHRLILGTAPCDEKHAAAKTLLATVGIVVPEGGAMAEACSDGAEEVIEAGKKGEAVATVISSYAQPLLEGCGTIKKGDLKVVGETAEVPFITAFVDGTLDGKVRGAIIEALLAVRHDPVLRLAIETKRGFLAVDAPAAAPAEGDGALITAPAAAGSIAAAQSANPDWAEWRGAGRAGIVPWLPATLPAKKIVRWKQVLFNEGLGGVAVAGDRVVVGDRDSADQEDVFHGLDRATGERVWTVRYPAAGKLDYGNSPRATPLLHDGRAYLLGAFGHLHCVRLADGRIEWQRHLRNDFQADAELVWGVCSSPLIVDGRLIVNPGAREASLVALDPATGTELWRSAGAPPAFASLVVGEVAGRRQLVGFDKESCGGWDPATGERLWRLVPRVAGDFNVPTPILLGDRVAVVSENNGARLIGIDPAGAPAVVASYAPLVPDMHTPVVTAGRLFAVNRGKAYCLDAGDLTPVWTQADRALKGHVSLVASADRVLALTAVGELILLDAHADRFEPLARQRLFERDVSLYAHPAVADTAIYVRGPRNLLCVALDGPSADLPGG
jgi:outer membrane protein assembly factor BamB/ABC-type phosphate/phosphonate transport system substrate-binding protein